MPESCRSRFGRWLERFDILHPLLFRTHGSFADGSPCYVNRISSTMKPATR